MPLNTIYKDLIDQIITTLKTITELSDTTDLRGKSDSHVNKWKTARTPKTGDYEVVVLPGPMIPVTGFTTKSSLNEFSIFCDLIFYGIKFDTAFDSAIDVASKIYDKFHRTSVSGNVDVKTNVSINPGDGQLNRGLLAVPIRIIITTEKTITQT